MSYTNFYTNDVFISYAHADDAGILGSDKGWVLNFVDDLEKSLAMKLGKKENETPFIWKDEELERNKLLTDALVNELKKTAVFLIIMSPSYLKSDWCGKELKQFLEIAQDKNASGRIFIVEIDELNRNEYPTEIDKNLLTYRFWTKEKGSKAKTLGIPKRDNEEYYTRLIDIRNDLAKELSRIKDSANTLQAQPTYKSTIFLAQVTDDLDEKREEIKRYLKDSGYKILPEDNWYAKESFNELREDIKQNLNQSSLYVQLLSNLPGKKILNTENTLVKFQFEMAQTSGKKMLIWRPSNFNTEDVTSPEHKKILESEYVRTGIFEEFKAAITTALQPAPAPLPPAPGNSKFLYICTDEIDKDYCENTILKIIDERNQEIETNNIQKNKIDCFFPLENASSPDSRKYNDDSFLISDAALFVYCNSDPSTVLNQINYCRKINIRRKEPFDIVALYDGPPTAKNQIPLRMASLRFTYLNCRENLKDFTEKFLNIL